MTWFRVDDGLAFHVKTLRAGNEAMGMWVRAGAEASAQLTDGFIDDELVKALGGKRIAERLVAARLWTRVDSGYQFHDWVDRNPTRGDVERERDAVRDRKERWKERRQNGSGTRSERVPDEDGTEMERVPNGDGTKTERDRNSAPARSVTRPDPTQEETALAAPKQTNGRKGTRLPPTWSLSPELEAWSVEHHPNVDRRIEEAKFRDYWTAASGSNATKLDWDATWRNWMRNAKPAVGARAGYGPWGLHEQ